MPNGTNEGEEQLRNSNIKAGDVSAGDLTLDQLFPPGDTTPCTENWFADAPVGELSNRNIKAGEVCFIKTSGEIVFVLDVHTGAADVLRQYPALSGQLAVVRVSVVNK